MSIAVRRLLLVVVILALGLIGAGCSKEKKVSEGRSPTEVMDLAKQKLDDTPGLNLTLTTSDLPDGIEGITDAKGVVTDAPAYDGTITVMVAGMSAQVPVIAVDDKVYAQLPLTPGWSDIDPADYGAPDPANLLDPDTGFSSLLPLTDDLKEGDTVRGGKDNEEVLTEFTGTVPGEAMKKVIPSSTGDTFAATYTIAANGELRKAVFTGQFYPDSDDMSYTASFDDYGTDKDITAP